MEPQSREPKPMVPERRKLNNISLIESLGIASFESLFYSKFCSKIDNFVINIR